MSDEFRNSNFETRTASKAMRRAVTVVGYEFDCGVPAHTRISADAHAGNVSTATRRAVGKMLRAPQLRWMRVRAFKLQVVVTK
jgi:hypothetical protein